MMGWEMGWNWGWMLFGGVAMVLFWGGIIALVVLAVRGLNRSSRTGHYTDTPQPSTQTPLEILQVRYARGEINKQEYETIRQDLQA
jgi:putative membrane protein